SGAMVFLYVQLDFTINKKIKVFFQVIFCHSDYLYTKRNCPKKKRFVYVYQKAQKQSAFT
ncbi:MAG: hypothetical protein ACI37J_04755, partial [Candidatus Bruticola sp.]